MNLSAGQFFVDAGFLGLRDRNSSLEGNRYCLRINITKIIRGMKKCLGKKFHGFDNNLRFVRNLLCSWGIKKKINSVHAEK